MINHKGIDFYKRVIKSIKDKGTNFYFLFLITFLFKKLIIQIIYLGMEPFVTLFHWDVPQALEELYGGFRDERIM